MAYFKMYYRMRKSIFVVSECHAIIYTQPEACGLKRESKIVASSYANFFFQNQNGAFKFILGVKNILADVHYIHIKTLYQ